MAANGGGAAVSPSGVSPPGALLRDGRVGGRHTAIEHAYGHHFADEEKKVAKKVVDRLLVMGILRKKLNEGQFHVYIDPRRLREVWAIINMEWKDEGVFG